MSESSNMGSQVGAKQRLHMVFEKKELNWWDIRMLSAGGHL
jgi:hypothetical protein